MINYVKLTPKTRKGEQRIKQYGDTGEILHRADCVHFSNEEGLWLLVQAADRFSRWVHLTNDKHFTVEILK